VQANHTGYQPMPAATNGDEQHLSDEQLKKVKTDISKKELKDYQALLLEKRAEITGDIDTMEAARAAARGSELSHMPLHMADVGSDAYEEEFTLGLMESERRLLYEIDEALVRIEKGTYGVCLESGKPINKARLEVAPWAKYCIEVAREREKRQSH
jgi:DnaK suppressor protein